MSRMRMLVAVLCATAATLLTTAVASTSRRHREPAETILVGSAVPFTSFTPSTGDLAGSNRLTVELWLNPDLAAAEQFADAVSTPGSPLFRGLPEPCRVHRPVRRVPRRGGRRRSHGCGPRGSPRSARTPVVPTFGRPPPFPAINAAFRIRLQTYRPQPL